ncbi:MAG: hypothetical protein GY795_30715 [Desulfobacterales bacterium]|nr:hypothetical protein [Desulfobacterales bacterium]
MKKRIMFVLLLIVLIHLGNKDSIADKVKNNNIPKIKHKLREMEAKGDIQAIWTRVEKKLLE